MLPNKQTKLNLAILLMATVVVGLTMTAWATHKEGHNPGGGKPGGGDDPVLEASYHVILISEPVIQITPSGVLLSERSLIEPARDAQGEPVWDSDGDAQADGYSTTTLTLGGYLNAVASSVNEESGFAVGIAWAGGYWQPVLWTDIWSTNADGTAGTLADLGHSNNAQDGMETDINSRGQVVIREGGRDHSWSPWGMGLSLVNPKDTDGDGNPDTWFEDIDGDGNNDLMIDLEGTSPGGGSGYLRINELGQIAGASNFGADAFVILPEDTDSDGEPDMWFKDGNGDGSNDLQIYLGSDSQAHDISDAGLIVGHLIEGRKYYLAKWQTDQQGQVNLIVKKLIRNRPSMLNTNENSQVVGILNNKTDYGILWENGEVLKLIELLDNPGDVDILLPRSINDLGTIAGSSCYYDSSEKMTRCYEGFIAVPLAQ